MIKFLKKLWFRPVKIVPITTTWLGGEVDYATIFFLENGFGWRRLKKKYSFLMADTVTDHPYWNKVALPWKYHLED